jgi:hypothetical protein
MFQTFAQHFTQLDFLGARYYDNVNDGFDGNNNATDSLYFQNNRYVGDNRMSAATNDDITDTPVFI